LGKIKILEKTVADKIAAGEVVERPASVAKELIENAIDAKARSIQVNLENGGQKLIEVIDDGIGMSPEDAELALQRFATSKIQTWEELEGLRTFGFRGEALPSIGAISKLEIITREESSATASRILCEGGEITEKGSIGAPTGTRVMIRDIFYNTPARRKFLKSASAETAHIVGITQKLALVNDEIAFRLTSNGRKLLDFPSQMTIRERILSIWGLPLDYKSIYIEHEGSSVRVTGYICPPGKLKSHRSYQSLFVNGRYINNRMINQAVQEGFSPLLPSGKFPIALIFIDVQGADLDINVHPNKMEVRFARPGAIFKTVRDAIKKELRHFGYVPTLVPEQIPGSPDQDSFIQITQPAPDTRQIRGVLGGTITYAQTPTLPFDIDREKSGSYGSSIKRESSAENSGHIFSGEEKIPEEGDFDASRIQMSYFSALAQIQKTYIVGKLNDEIWLVDQHTAHERINFERLSHIGKDLSASQKLLFPIMLELPPTLFNFLQDKMSDFEELGFEVEPFGGSSVLIKAVPFGFKKLDNKETIIEILEEAAEGEPYRNLSAFFEQLRASIACKTSVRAGDTLTIEEMNALVNELIIMDYSSYCPHGRPVVIKISKEHLDRMFHRI